MLCQERLRKISGQTFQRLSLLPHTRARPSEGGSLVPPGGPGPTRGGAGPADAGSAGLPAEQGPRLHPRDGSFFHTATHTATPRGSPSPCSPHARPRCRLPEDTFQRTPSVTRKHCWSLPRSTSQCGPAPRSLLPPASNTPREQLPRPCPVSLLHTHSHSRVHTHARSLPCSHHLHPHDAHSGHAHRQTRVSYVPTRAPAHSTWTTALGKHRGEVRLPLAGSSSRGCHRPLPSPAPGGHTPQSLDPEAPT